jgi:KDO2-lipid IV(A) lauroyltransferase
MTKQRTTEADRFKGPSKWLQYIFARGLVTCIQCLPLGFAFRLGRGVGWLCWKLMKRRRAVVHKNLEIVNAFMKGRDACPQASVEEGKAAEAGGSLSKHSELESLDLEEQVREVFQRSGANLIAGFPLSRLGPKRMEQHLEIVGVEHLRHALAKGKGAIMLLAHMGPWEALAHLPTLAAKHGVDAPLGAMYRPLNNTYLDEWIRTQRQSMGTRLFSRRDGFHKPVDFLRRGGVLGILADQKMRQGPRVPYFGVEVPSSPIPGLFHRRSGAPLLALSIETTALAKWRIAVSTMEVSEDLDVSSREVLATVCNQAIAGSLVRSPLDGFWLHKRF